MFIPNRESLAWAAGFFDGEGCITSISRGTYGKRRKVVLSIWQIDPEPLERFRSAVGGIGSIKGPFDRGNPKHSPIWYYLTNRPEEVQAVIAMLWIFLSTPKRKDAERVLSDLHTAQREYDSNKSSRYKSVYWSKVDNKWKVAFRLKGKSYYGGLYSDEIEAGRVAKQLREKVTSIPV